MALEKEDLQHVAAYVKAHLGEWLAEQSLGKPPAVYEIELRERMVRVEEELKHQRQLMQQGFDLMERRFEQIEKRFEQIDRRFEQIEKRFEQVDKRFEQIDKRFDQVDRRFEAITRRLDRFMIWSFGITITAAGTVIAAIRLWPAP